MFMVSEKGFFLPQHKFPTVIQLITNKYINSMILHFFSKASSGVFHIQLGGFDFINYINFIHSTDTNGVKNYVQLYGKN